MAGSILGEAPTAFRIRRPPGSNGSISDVDPTVKAQLRELNSLLGKRVFEDPDAPSSDSDDNGDARTAEKSTGGSGGDALNLKELLRTADLKAKRTKKPYFPPRSLGALLDAADDNDENLTLAEVIETKDKLATIKTSVEKKLRAERFSLDDRARTILGDEYSAIRDYLIAYGYHVKRAHTQAELVTFVLHNSRGVEAVANYALVSAARAAVDKRALDVDGIDEDDSGVVREIKRLGMSATAFVPGLLRIVNDRRFDDPYEKIIKESEIGKGLPTDMIRRLVPYAKALPVELTADNVDSFLPTLIHQAAGEVVIEDEEPDTDFSDGDFEIDRFEDDSAVLEVSRSAVRCAAQLFHAMVAGDELDVFGVVDYFTRKYLIRGGIEVLDGRLRDDLQNYVFSDRFTDLKTGRMVDRTRGPERQMFYRQAFNLGRGNVTEDVYVNGEFPRLWKVLILESAQYLERAQMSPNPDSFVSRQQVMQAVEDLQYNLSTHCTGIATVISPLIDAELRFVIRRIFMHEEVRRHVVPSGGSWLRVVERLAMEMKRARPQGTVLYNKATFGHDIIRAIADYEPAQFEDDEKFSEFISNVDAFITTQSILQDGVTDDLRQEHAEDSYDHAPPAAPPEMAGAPSGSNGGGPPADEWDF
jgi:hypothetical protein